MKLVKMVLGILLGSLAGIAIGKIIDELIPDEF